MREEMETAGELSVDKLEAGFDPNRFAGNGNSGRGTTISFWGNPDDKALFDLLQQATNRQFGKFALECLRILMRRQKAKLAKQAGLSQSGSRAS